MSRMSRMSGREVRFMLFVSIKAALKRPSIWIMTRMVSTRFSPSREKEPELSCSVVRSILRIPAITPCCNACQKSFISLAVRDAWRTA